MYKLDFLYSEMGSILLNKKVKYSIISAVKNGRKWYGNMKFVYDSEKNINEK